jgi:hypothetical protein
MGSDWAGKPCPCEQHGKKGHAEHAAQRTRIYLLDYPFEGGQYNVQLAASSWEDARARLDAIKAWGKIEGEIHAKIPAPFGLGWLARLCADFLVWWRSRA